MLRRHQVLLTDWRTNYIRHSYEKFDFSFSEVVRILISERLLSIIFSLKPNNRIGITEKELLKIEKSVLNLKILRKKDIR